MEKRRAGFSLVEMAIVLIIFGMVLASASSILTLFVNKGGAERTRKMIEANKNSVFSIAATDGYLQSADITDGTETKTANIVLSYPNDAYGVPFHVVSDASLGYVAGKVQLDYSPVCGTDSTNMEVHICDDITCATTTDITNVAMVLVSGSVNKNVQTDAVLTGGVNVVTVSYQGQVVSPDPYTTGIDRDEKYDDIVDWVTLPELRAKAGCEPEKLRFLDTAMPVIQNDAAYIFSLFAEGGVPFRQSAANPDVKEYNFTLVDDGGLPSDIEFRVVDEGGYTQITEAGIPNTSQGTYLMLNGNTDALGTNPYLVEISVSDDSASVSNGSNNTITRTLYIRPQN